MEERQLLAPANIAKILQEAAYVSKLKTDRESVTRSAARKAGMLSPLFQQIPEIPDQKYDALQL